MPIVERDPWREQYFTDVHCPSGVQIPTEDGDSYQWYPKHRWVYNKLLISESQKIPCGPHGVEPDFFPIFSKPIYNMRGMGAGSTIFRSMEEYKNAQIPGHMWMALLNGEHISTDVAVVNGNPNWWRHVVGKPLKEGMFDYWVVLAEARLELEKYCQDWIKKNLSNYTGLLNLETMGGKILEVHLRFSDQWPDLYGKNWIESLVDLYDKQKWEFEDRDRKDGYSVVLFGAHGIKYKKPNPDLVNKWLDHPMVSSIQITFYEDKPLKFHAMPPGGFRLAIINCFDLEIGMEVRNQLALAFWSTQKLIKKKKNKRKIA